MLPTSGYFRGVACPAYEKGQCKRPYCHFRHNPKKVPENSCDMPVQASSAMDVNSDDTSSQIKSKPSSSSVEDLPSCSSTEASSIVNPNVNAQSELLQQLVSEAVKKVLIENPHLTSAGVDPSSLIQQTTAEVSPANSKSRKKYYLRPPDTPSYNPTPIRELNKRKLSGECNEDSASNSKAAKYVPTSLVLKNLISDASESKESGDSEATDFSSAEEEDLDKQNCDFDILEEVLAEHSQNNKIKVKKKKVKALGKLQYNLSNRDKKVDESSMISDARTLSDQDSNTCDGSKDGHKEYIEPAVSYFLPPSPIFTSSSDGFGSYNSVVYSKSETNEEKHMEVKSVEEGEVTEELEDTDHLSIAAKDFEYSKILDQKKEETTSTKSMAKGHLLLPKFIPTLGTPKLSRPCLRTWNPQSRIASVGDTCKDSVTATCNDSTNTIAADTCKDSTNTSVVGTCKDSTNTSTADTCKGNSDSLEAMLQQMDEVQVAQRDRGDECSKTLSDTIKPVTSSPKNSKKCKVGLDRESKSSTSTPSVNRGGKGKTVDEEVNNPVLDNVQKEKVGGKNKKLVGAVEKVKKKSGRNVESDLGKEGLKVVSPKEKEKKRESRDLKSGKEKKPESKDLKSGKESSDEERLDKEKKPHDETSEAEDALDKEKRTDDESESDRELRKKKRKRDRSSGSESHESYHRKKRKKGHKRRKKYKKRRRRRGSRSESDESEAESVKEDKANEKEENDKSESSEADDKEENGKPKKHKKRKKKSRHRKKSKYRKRSKNKLRKKGRSHSQSASLSSSQDRSRSTSQHRSRSSSRHRSHSKHRSRSHSRHTSRSHSRHRSSSNSRHQSRSTSRHRSGSTSRHRSGSTSRHRSRSTSRHRSRSPSKERNKGLNKIRHSSEHTNTGHESDNQTATHRKDSKSKSQAVSDTVTSSKKDKEKIHPLSTPMPIDPSKIKVEKDVYKNVTAIVPDLSIVKTEKEDNSTLPCTSIKVEKTDNQNETTQVLNSTNASKDCSKEKSIGRSDSHHEKTKDLKSSASSKRETSSQEKLSKETGFQHLCHKEKEQKRISMDKERKESDCERRTSTESNKERREGHHDRRSSTESSKGRWKSNQDRRDSSETLLSRKPGRQDSTDSKKSEKDHPSPKTSRSQRISSVDKNRDSNVSSTSHQDSQPKGFSIFDMVAASIPPSKPRALKEISMFDNISQEGYESSSDSPSHSDLDEENLSQENELPDLSSNHPSTNQKKSLSHSRNKHSSDKHSSSSKVDKVKSHTKSVKDKHSHKSSLNLVKSKSHGESEKESKNEHLSSRKHKTTSHHSDSSSYKTSSSSHKSNSNSSKELPCSKDIGTSSKSSHSSISKDKNSKSVSRGSKDYHKSDPIGSDQSRKHSFSSHDKEKEHGSSTPKSRDHSKKSSVRERETSGSHGKGKETTNKDSLDSEKDYDKSSSHKKGKDCSKNKHDKEKEHSHKKVVTNNKLIMKEHEDRTSSSSSGMSDRELEAANDDDDDDDDEEGGNNSPFPDLSVLDEIPQDDWEQMMSSSDRVDLKHLENLRAEVDFDLDDLDKDDPGVMEECLQMYNDYKPDPVDVERQASSKKKKVEPKVESEPLPSKQRVARSTSVGNMVPTKSGGQAKHLKKTPAQVMRERYEKLKEQQAELLKQLERQKQQLEEQSRGVAAAASSSSAVSSTTSHRSKQSVVSSSNVSSTTPSRSKIAPASSSTSGKSSPHSTSGVTKRRMSHVPNVTSLLQARERIKNLPPTNKRSLISANIASAPGSSPQTIAHTVAKGGKRFAHIPQLETLQRPTIAPEFGSKVPPNIRQRYLNSLIDECLKFLAEKDAFSLGLAEERVCYQRASSRMVYLNLAVNSVKRLRNQQEAGEAAQELLETDPMFKDHTFLEEQPSSSEKPSTSGISSSPSKEVKSHPVNPNHSRLSHFSVLAVGGNRGSWSIEKPKKDMVNVQNYLKGSNFYKYLKKYLLTDKQIEANGFPAPDPEEKGKAIVKVVDTRKKLSPSSTERYCDRCSVLYTVDKWGFPLSLGPCVHHWGRPYKRRGYSGALETKYSCCGGDLEADGCCQATTHVSQNYDPNELRGFVRTLPKEGNDNDYGVYALDCEMSYTTAGNELTRVTVIDTAGNTVYEQLVKPENPIIDYNTRFSGITESDMENVKTSIRDVQAAMLTRFSDKTILIGHSLESDFHALKLIHDTVVDTSVVFPHKMGPPFKRALKNLASEYLKKIIQNDVSGHDSAEDAVTCMHLMQWRIKEDFKGFSQK